MWRLSLFYIMGVCMYEVLMEDPSTQIFYVKLTVEESVIDQVNKSLLNKDYSFGEYKLYNLQQTTVCNPEKKTCNCAAGFEWSPSACSSQLKCCGTDRCTHTGLSCISKNTVTINGVLTLKPTRFHGCLDDHTSDNFKICSKNLTDVMKRTYSQLYGFDHLTVTAFRAGSVIVEFEVVVASNVEPSILEAKSRALTAQLNASLNLETQGVVYLKVPPGPVPYATDPTLRCSSDSDLRSSPHWELTNYLNITKNIHNGTMAKIISGTLSSKIQLTNVSELWNGKYTCSFEQNQGNLNIKHKASAKMDVCFVPLITTRTTPGFPRCDSSTDLRSVNIYCEVEHTYEEYNVTWTKKGIDAKIIAQPSHNSPEMTVFRAQTFVSCNSDNAMVTCQLTNRCNQMTEAVVNIILIKVGDTRCFAEGDWEDTKAGEVAVIKCSDSVGNRSRPCSSDGAWGKETSFCVNPKLRSVLTNAEACDTGLGKLETNAEYVFNQLQSVTNNTKVISGSANVETSVKVIGTMSNKLSHLDNETTVNDFLRSSSNLMDRSLSNSWTAVSTSNESKHLAEIYLLSVEELIEEASISTGQRKSPNLELFSSNQTKTEQRVFKNTVTVDSQGARSVKTAGFLQLEHYLPNQDSAYSPNSIVLSTIIEPKENINDVKIRIKFHLKHPRPRNTEMKCVFWDTDAHVWSGSGCKWDYSSGAVCECNHLSAFTILMSKGPLEVPYLSEVTYAGLSVSIVSLIVCLGIELILWRDVVKTDTLHLRHCAHVNISICLLVGDVCFLASALSGELSDVWCKTFVVVEHFCFLAMFFWMFCLSSILLHKTVYLSLQGISKTVYLRFSVIVGYVCPLLIVTITFLANNGEEGRYYSKETRWLVYSGTLKGSIFTFIVPVMIIVFVNIFFMCLVIMKLLMPTKATRTLADKEKNSAKTAIRSVILLTPVFGVTWGFGFLVILFDLSQGAAAFAINYIFTLLNAFQGLYIFLTTCLGDKMVRDGLRRYLQRKTSGTSARSTNNSSSSSSVDQSPIKKQSLQD